MRYVFIQTRAFKAEAEAVGLTLEDFRGLENLIGRNPGRWPVMSGTGGVRKVRFAPQRLAGGKSGGIRVCYFVMDAASHVYLIALFAKSEKANLNEGDKKRIQEFVTRVKASY